MSNSKEVGRAPGIPPESRLGSSLATLTRRFAGEDRGSIAPLFALMVIPFSMSVGMAVDYGRIVMVQQKTQGMIDAAALAGGRAYQQASTDKIAAMEKAIDATWNSMSTKTASFIEGGSVKKEYVASTGQVRVVSTQWVRTPFMSSASVAFARNNDPSAPGICNQSGWFCAKVEQMAGAQVQTTQLNNADFLEISMMLDVTGSMNSLPSGQTSGNTKFVSMKSAARSFIDIVLPQEDPTGVTRVALVPFGGGVYPPESVYDSVTKPLATGCTRNVSGCSTYQFTKYDDRNISSTSRSPTLYSAIVSAKCLVDRKGTEEFTDVLPSGTGLFPRFYPKDRDGVCDHYTSSNPRRNRISPLASDPVVLKEQIQELTNVSDTAGHLGTAWAWYMLSPDWASILPSASQPKPYGDSKVKKIAILLTDGAYNTQYCNGFDTDLKHSKSESQKSVQCTATSAFTAAEKLCENMKKPDKNIIVYTIGFDIDSTSNEFLKKKCATSEAHHYDVKSESAIDIAFSDIALKTTQLRLSK